MASRDIVLITGATGFIGRALVRTLADDFTIVALDRAGPPEPPAPAHAVDFDLSTDDGVDRALAEVRERFGERIASVIHLAAYYDVSGRPNPLYDTITVQGARRLIDGLQSFEVERFVFASTMLVHRPTGSPDEQIDEGSPLGPAWAYPESKVRTEAVLKERRGSVPLVLLRIAGVYDDLGRSPFLAEQIARIYEHRLTAHLYPGMLCAGQSFVHVEDLADAFARAVRRRRDLPAEIPILVGEPDALGYGEVQDVVGRALHGEDWTTLRIPRAVAKAGAWFQTEALGDDEFVKPWMVDQSDAHYVLDIGRARALLGWEPAHSLRETLPRMVEALKRDPQAWYRANKLDPALVAWHGRSPTPPQTDGEADAHAGHGSPADVQRRSPPAAPEASPHEAHAQGAHGNREAEFAPDRDPMAKMDYDARRARWAYFATVGLGLWLAASPLTYDATASAAVGEGVRAVTAERGLPSVEARSAWLAFSDVASGLLIATFGALSLSKRGAGWAPWGTTFVGLWLFFAPIVLWSPSGAQYLNNLLVGSFVIALSVLIPMMPGMSMAGMMDPKNVPPGWTYSPSTWSQRLPIAALGLVGLLISRVLTAYQLGHVGTAWDPFFAGAPGDPKNGTEEIVTSSVSMAWPVPDAGLGAIAYVLEILMAVMGGRDRWRTMPWMVAFFGILVVPLGVVSIYFIIIQPVMLGTWCTLCLAAALAMLVMIPFALDEVIATGQYLWWARCRRMPILRVFFQGGPVDGGQEDASDTLTSPRAFWRDAMRGVTLPHTLVASMAVGALLMLTRVLLGTSGPMADSDHVVGALVITVAIIATAEVARPVRLVNVVLGAWLVAAPFLLDGESMFASAVSVVLGLGLAVLSLPRGVRSKERYAGWDRYVV
jgi:nucleoside-diphosphate-sugar epimerase/uncharacterized membrane protein